MSEKNESNARPSSPTIEEDTKQSSSCNCSNKYFVSGNGINIELSSWTSSATILYFNNTSLSKYSPVVLN